MYYYAHIDSDYLVYEVCALNKPTTDSYYIAITEAQYNDEGLIGMRYDPDYETFMEPIYWIGSTGVNMATKFIVQHRRGTTEENVPWSEELIVKYVKI